MKTILKKAPYIHFSSIIVLLLFSIFLYIFFVNGIENYDDYSRLNNNAVKVTASITSIKEITDPEDSGYQTYITYEYDGTRYSDIKYEELSSKPSYGEKVIVEIDPVNPTHLLKDYDVSYIVLCGLPFFLFVFILTLSVPKTIAYNREKSNNWENTYNSEYINVEIIKQDIEYFKKTEKKILFKVSVFIVALLLCISIIHYVRNKSYTYLLSMTLFLSLYIVFVLVAFVWYNKSANNYSIEKDVLIRREYRIGGGEDNSTTEVWIFKNRGEWIPKEEAFVSFKNHSLSDFYISSEFYLALEKGKKIVRIYDAKEFKT